MQQFFVQVNGAEEGPYSADQIRGYLAMGHMQHKDLAWHEGLPDWKPLEQFSEFPARAHRTPNYAQVPVRNLAQKKKKKSKGIMGTVLTVLVIGAAGAGGYYFWRDHQQKAAAAAEAAAGPVLPTDSAFASGTPGIPKTLEELNQWYAEPASGQNAATFFQQGFAALQITDADRNSTALPLIGKAPMASTNGPALPLPGAPLSPATKTALRGLIERNQPALDLFEKGAQFSGSRYPIDLNKGVETLVPHLPKLKMAATLAALNALWQADARNGTNASDAVLLALASARTLESEPALVSQLERVADLHLVVDALEQTVNRVALKPEQLTDLQTAFDHAVEFETTGTAFNRGFVTERISGLAVLDLPAEQLHEQIALLTKSPMREAGITVPEKAAGNLKEQRQFYETSLDQVLSARKDQFPGRLKADELLLARVNDAKAKEYFYCAMMLPGVGKISGNEARGLARLRVAQTAIALERFRAANKNHYPDSLNQLAPQFLAAVPADPFDGQPLRYHKAGDGYRLYSVGQELKDDGGVRKAGADNLLFAVGRPPRAT